MRNPNSTCSGCGLQSYRRPNEIKRWAHVEYRCQKCRAPKAIPCPHCGELFLADHNRGKFCSRSCSNRGRRGKEYRRIGFANKTQVRLAQLKDAFNFKECMIEGCHYSRCYDIHRFVPGKEGGEYEIGNMFAICPNHHGEITRRIIEVDKVSDCLLRISMDRQSDARLTESVLKTDER